MNTKVNNKIAALVILVACMLASATIGFAGAGGDASQLIGGIHLSVAPTLTNGIKHSLTLNTSGELLVASAAGASATEVQGTAADGAATSGDPVVVAIVDSGSVVRNLTTESGASDNGTLRVSVSTGDIVQVDGPIGEGAAIGTPVLISARDPSGNVLTPHISSDREFLIQSGARGVWTDSSGTEYPITMAIATITNSAEIIAAVGGERIVPLRIILSADTASTLQLEENSGGTAIWPPLAFAANSGFDTGEYKELFETTAGEHLFLTVGTAQTAGGAIIYYIDR